MAERELTAAMLTAIAAATVRPAIFYEGEFVDSGEAQAFLRFWTGTGTITEVIETARGPWYAVKDAASGKTIKLRAANLSLV